VTREAVMVGYPSDSLASCLRRARTFPKARK